MSVKHYYDTGQGLHKRDRAQSEIKAQEAYEMRLREQARATLIRLRAQGKRVSVHYSGCPGNRGIAVMPVPRLTPEGYLAWQVR
jgi:hypothetical protein